MIVKTLIQLESGDLESFINKIKASLVTTRHFKHFQSYNHLCKDEHRASGGVSFLIRKDMPHQQINIDSELQMIAAKTTLHKPVNICSIYIPPHDPKNNKKLHKLIEQIPKPHILLGDLNSHSTIWGCLKTNKKALIWRR